MEGCGVLPNGHRRRTSATPPPVRSATGNCWSATGLRRDQGAGRRVRRDRLCRPGRGHRDRVQAPSAGTHSIAVARSPGNTVETCYDGVTAAGDRRARNVFVVLDPRGDHPVGRSAISRRGLGHQRTVVAAEQSLLPVDQRWPHPGRQPRWWPRSSAHLEPPSGSPAVAPCRTPGARPRQSGLVSVSAWPVCPRWPRQLVVVPGDEPRGRPACPARHCQAAPARPLILTASTTRSRSHRTPAAGQAGRHGVHRPVVTRRLHQGATHASQRNRDPTMKSPVSADPPPSGPRPPAKHPPAHTLATEPRQPLIGPGPHRDVTWPRGLTSGEIP